MVVLTINILFVLETLIFGIIASLIGAILLEQWKKHSNKYHISVKLDSSDVYSPQIGKDVSIKVDYKGKAVDNSLVILYLSITNDGKEDIMFKSHFSDVIKIKCRGYKFLSITAEDEMIKPECGLTEEGAILSWDILKVGERIQLCIAAQSEQPATSIVDRVDSYNNLTFEFRSDCIDAIEPSYEMTKRDTLKRRFYNGSVLKSVYMLFVCFLIVLFDMSFSSRYDISYEGQTYKNSTLLYTPLFKKYILSSDSAKTQFLTKEDVQCFDSIVPTNPDNMANKVSWVLELMILLVILLSLATMILSRVGYSMYKKRLKRKTDFMKKSK